MRGVFADGGKIKQLRRARGWTQEDLAARASCDVKTLRKAEHGKNLDFHVLGKIATALGARFPDLVARRGEPQSEQVDNAKIVEAWMRAFNQRDIDLLMSFFHENAIIRAPGSPDIPFGGEFRGRAQIRRVHEIAFQTAETEPLERDQYTLHAFDDRVILHGTAKLTSKETGATTELWALHLFRLKKRSIVELHVNYDALAMRNALGRPPEDE